ncbi:MAG: ATP-binding cassette domain-containing protein [Gemmatimonadota bacterium]|nr:ATP-binding cassette domain-containing protein [Gemmatimonadota bacterium]MDH4352262.1 ATP-binding cassette domain-containing protein [Gemmatimonadota bacterium]MDH5196460.1 ATP-binding cassette domain-containing protein [Gemmatimonadota bacterium]
MLALRDVTHEYLGRVVADIPALDLPAGTTTALVGPNGSGKSTVLRLLAAVEAPSRGVLELHGRAVRSSAERLHARRAVTLVEQHPLLFDMTVAANLTDALRLRGARRVDGRQISEALELVGAGSLAARPARALSGGEAQRVAIARALLLAPQVLLLDEPLSAADRAAREALGNVLAALRDRGTVVCLSSHVLEEAYRWSSRIFTLVDGRLEGMTPENLFRVDLPPGTGSREVRVGPLRFSIVTDRSGPAIIAVPPEDILVSRTPLDSSALNQFPGRLTAISEDGHGRIRLAVDVGVELITRITPASLSRLELQVGTGVVLSFKAVAVRVF